MNRGCSLQHLRNFILYKSFQAIATSIGYSSEPKHVSYIHNIEWSLRTISMLWKYLCGGDGNPFQAGLVEQPCQVFRMHTNCTICGAYNSSRLKSLLPSQTCCQDYTLQLWRPQRTQSAWNLQVALKTHHHKALRWMPV